MSQPQPARPRLRFRRGDRVTLRRDFARAYAARCTSADDGLVVYAVANGLEWARIGISVSRRVGNAVVRNRVKRRIREAFRTQRADLPVGFDLIVVAKPAAAAQGASIAQALVRLVGHAVKKLERRTTVRRPGLRPNPPPTE